MRYFKVVLAILFILILPPTQGYTSGCVSSDGSNIVADLATAQAGARCLEIAAGVFQVAPNTLLGNVDGLRIFGQGMGRTILKVPDTFVVSAQSYIIRLTGKAQSVSDLTIAGGASITGTNTLAGISIYAGATLTHVQRVEVVGLYGGTTAGASGIDLYQPWGTGGGWQGAVVEDCYIHDGPYMTGIVVNSNGNTVRGNVIRDVGNTFSRHGIYIQGGYNLIDGNDIERVGGYSLHAYEKVQGIDGSGNVFTHNLSIDPGFQHMIVSGLASSGVNPAIPSGRMLTRTVTIQSNTFRNTASLKRAGVTTDVPALISDNTFEDVVMDGAAALQVASAASNSVVRGNVFRALQPGNSNGGAIKLDAAALCDGNSIDTRGYNYAIGGGSSPGTILGVNLIYRST